MTNYFILEDDKKLNGRPYIQEFHNYDAKLNFMKEYGITKSVVSMANPWLDIDMPNDEKNVLAQQINEEFENKFQESQYKENFLGYGVISLTDPDSCIQQLFWIAHKSNLKGIIIGTKGFGDGLACPQMERVWQAIEELGLVVFIHPHHGIKTKEFEQYGYTLNLGLGFTFETTICASKLILSGIFDKFPKLKIVLSHAGGSLPYLAARISNCYDHDVQLRQKIQKKPVEYLKDFYYDGIIYHEQTLQFLINMVGSDRIMFGTDNPFFNPEEYSQAMGQDEGWIGVKRCIDVISKLDEQDQDNIYNQTATKLFNIKEEAETSIPVHQPGNNINNQFQNQSK